MASTIIKLTPTVGEGAFACVALDYTAGIAHKIFKKKDVTTYEFRNSPWENEIRQCVFLSEYEAYKAAMIDESACKIVPKLYEHVQVSKVLDNYDNDVSDHFLLDCCFSMELIEGNFVKFMPNGISVVPEIETQRVKQILLNAGIRYFNDASITITASSQRIHKIIDFALCDTYYEEEKKHLWLSGQ